MTDKKEFDIKKLDALAQLYLDGRLSQLEETELEYVLSHTDLNTEAIAEVRQTMELDNLFRKPSLSKPQLRRYVKWRFSYKFATVAASVVIIITMAIALSVRPKSQSVREDDFVIAYAGGIKLDKKEAEESAGAAISRAEALMAMERKVEAENAVKAQMIMDLISSQK